MYHYHHIRPHPYPHRSVPIAILRPKASMTFRRLLASVATVFVVRGVDRLREEELLKVFLHPIPLPGLLLLHGNSLPMSGGIEKFAAPFPIGRVVGVRKALFALDVLGAPCSLRPRIPQIAVARVKLGVLFLEPLLRRLRR